MTLTYHRDNTELFQNCVLWWQGRDVSALGFPILPNGVSVSSAGTFGDLDLGNTKILKTFNNSNATAITLTDNPAWAITGDFTECLWFYCVSGPTYDMMLNQISSSSPYSYNQIWYYKDGACIYVDIYTADSQNYHINYGINFNTWYFLAFTSSGTSGKLYINGTLVATATKAGSIGDIATDLQIGHKNNAINNRHTGGIKDLMIFNGKALSASELTTIMRLTDPRVGNEIKPPILPGVRGVI